MTCRVVFNENFYLLKYQNYILIFENVALTFDLINPTIEPSKILCTFLFVDSVNCYSVFHSSLTKESSLIHEHVLHRCPY